jgi:hypothetical protein
MKAKNKNLMTLEEFKEKNYGKRGTKERDELEAGYENFKLSIYSKSFLSLFILLSNSNISSCFLFIKLILFCFLIFLKLLLAQ